MLSSLPTSLFSLLLASVSVVHAVNFSVRVRSSFASDTLQARDSNTTIPVHNTHNAEYIANITLGGREIPVLLDTGRYVRIYRSQLWCLMSIGISSDLWVTGDVPNTKDLGKAVSVTYAVGTAAGAFA